MTRAEIELLEECKIQLMHIHDVCKRKPFYTTKNLIKNIEAAISVTRCSLQLKAVDKLGYTQWKDKIGLIKDVDKGLYKLKGNYITINEVLDMFEVYCDSF
jgi:hypothetical protein|tara:strand:+ start:293 stop:595 length:303 start_codon:yes stop_codon:yes gene_type:complete